MKKKNSLRWSLTGISLVLVLALLVMAVPVSADPAFESVATGLNNPRGLAFGPEGALYVAEAGTGGSGPCFPGAEGTMCYGESSSVTRIKNGVQERIVTGLFSIALEEGNNAVGINDVSLLGRGGLAILVGLGGDVAFREGLPSGAAIAGHLVKSSADGTLKIGADLAQYEQDHNPDGGEVDSNPYGVLALPGKHLIADAGGNDLLQVDANGDISTLAVFPDRLVDSPDFIPNLPPQIPMQAVPTSVALGPDGAYYVGQLTGFPFPYGGARVYRVVPGEEPTIYAEGFTNIIDLAFDVTGNLYVLEIAANGLLSGDPTGALIKVDPDLNQTILASDGLITPGGLAIGADGSIYISNYSTFPGTGEVVRLTDVQAAPGLETMRMMAQTARSVYLPLLRTP